MAKQSNRIELLNGIFYDLVCDINSQENTRDKLISDEKTTASQIHDAFSKEFKFTDFANPQIRAKDGKGGYVNNVKNPQHYDRDGLEIGNPHCTASVEEALLINEMIMRSFGDTMFQIWSVQQKDRAKFPAQDVGAFTYCNKQIPKRREKFYNALKPTTPTVQKTAHERIVVQLDSIKKILDKEDNDYDKELKVVAMLRERFTKVN